MSNITLQSADLFNWKSLPAIGNINAYITAINQIPYLTVEQEIEYANRLKTHGCSESAAKLVMSHMRLVVSTARQYLGYGFSHADLIQEGAVGLMRAVKAFDPDKQVRMATYAIYWIKAEIQEYIVKNWAMVKIATTKAHRKLFFNLNSLKQKIVGRDLEKPRSLTTDQVHEIADHLDVLPGEVKEMEVRMAGGDQQLEFVDDDENEYIPQYLADDKMEPSHVLEKLEHNKLLTIDVHTAIDQLDQRSKHIISARWLNVDDVGAGGQTLHQLAEYYGVSHERIRQIEVQAMKKLKSILTKNKG